MTFDPDLARNKQVFFSPLDLLSCLILLCSACLPAYLPTYVARLWNVSRWFPLRSPLWSSTTCIYTSSMHRLNIMTISTVSCMMQQIVPESTCEERWNNWFGRPLVVLWCAFGSRESSEWVCRLEFQKHLYIVQLVHDWIARRLEATRENCIIFSFHFILFYFRKRVMRRKIILVCVMFGMYVTFILC